MTIFEYIADLEPKAGLYPDSIVRMQKFAADEEKRYDAQLAAAQKRIAELETAIESYRTGVEWGKVYAWLQHGAPTEGEGIAMAKRIIHLHVNADALAGGAS